MPPILRGVIASGKDVCVHDVPLAKEVASTVDAVPMKTPLTTLPTATPARRSDLKLRLSLSSSPPPPKE